MSISQLSVTLHFSGGMELLFDNKKTLTTIIPATFQDRNDGGESPHPTNMKDLIGYVAANLLRERPELFLGADGSVRSGILVLINDSDWELEGELEYELDNKDDITFISTLHGG